jgi:hypothetical protein
MGCPAENKYLVTLEGSSGELSENKMPSKLSHAVQGQLE